MDHKEKVKKINQKKRETRQKFKKQLKANDSFLIQRMREDWENIQKEAKKEEIVRKIKSGSIITSKTILKILIAGGVLTIALVAPNVLGSSFQLSKQKYYFNEKEFNKTKNYLKKNKYVDFKKINENTSKIILTEKGREMILREAFDGLKIKNNRWDGLWRIITFDIPDKHKYARDVFRKKLRDMGFYQLQKSVFVIPYQCEEEIDFIITMLGINDFICFMLVNKINNEEKIKDFFELT